MGKQWARVSSLEMRGGFPSSLLLALPMDPEGKGCFRLD